jgi:hypothetical protein
MYDEYSFLKGEVGLILEFMKHQVFELGGGRKQLFEEGVGVGTVQGKTQVELRGTHEGGGEEELSQRWIA